MSLTAVALEKGKGRGTRQISALWVSKLDWIRRCAVQTQGQLGKISADLFLKPRWKTRWTPISSTAHQHLNTSKTTPSHLTTSEKQSQEMKQEQADHGQLETGLYNFYETPGTKLNPTMTPPRKEMSYLGKTTLPYPRRVLMILPVYFVNTNNILPLFSSL